MKPRLTYATAAVLIAVQRGYRYGFDVMEATGLPGGTVYPILRRLEKQGRLASDWEDEKKAFEDQRPPRRYYRLTPDGGSAVDTALGRFPGLVRIFGDAEPA